MHNGPGTWIDPSREKKNLRIHRVPPTFDFNDNNDNKSNNDGLGFPERNRKRNETRRGRRKDEEGSKSTSRRRRLINGDGNFSLLPRYSSVTRGEEGCIATREGRGGPRERRETGADRRLSRCKANEEEDGQDK